MILVGRTDEGSLVTRMSNSFAAVASACLDSSVTCAVTNAKAMTESLGPVNKFAHTNKLAITQICYPYHHEVFFCGMCALITQ